jgi:hypothetical protein
MIFSVDEESKTAEPIKKSDFSELGILEENDIQEWAIDEPQLLGEDLLVISSEYSNFEDTRDRLDILALDNQGKLVVVELKRDQADKTTDLQAIKYAGYCATLTAEDIQKEYRKFHNEREDDEVTPEEVGEEFSEFLIDEVVTTDDGWVEFELDNKPRIVLAAGEYGTEVTAPVMWLIEEYGLDITCVKIQAYEKDGKTLLNSQQVIPPAEAEDYMTERREKSDNQGGLTETEKLRKEYWTQFKSLIEKEGGNLATPRAPPSKYSYFNSAIDRLGYRLCFTISTRKKEITTQIIIEDREGYYELEQQTDDIEDLDLEWQSPKEGVERGKIVVSKVGDLENKDEWEDYQDWMLKKAEKLLDAFYDEIQSL